MQDFTPAVDDFPSLVEAALRLSKRRPGRVWVLATEVWTQTLPLAAESVAGLGPAELARALGFEAEPFSGINGLEAASACVELPGKKGQRTFWLAVLPTGQLDQVDYVVRARGGRLAGVGHPGGLPRRMALTLPSPGGRGERGRLVDARRVVAGRDRLPARRGQRRAGPARGEHGPQARPVAGGGRALAERRGGGRSSGNAAGHRRGGPGRTGRAGSDSAR